MFSAPGSFVFYTPVRAPRFDFGDGHERRLANLSMGEVEVTKTTEGINACLDV